MKPRDSRITSGFGSGREFNGQVQSRHTGTDFAGAVGTPVRAAARGVVALADTFYLAGRVIYIDHGEGLVSAYFHLSRHDVAAGDTVQAGQVIGQVGATGRVTGPAPSLGCSLRLHHSRPTQPARAHAPYTRRSGARAGLGSFVSSSAEPTR